MFAYVFNIVFKVSWGFIIIPVYAYSILKVFLSGSEIHLENPKIANFEKEIEITKEETPKTVHPQPNETCEKDLKVNPEHAELKAKQSTTGNILQTMSGSNKGVMVTNQQSALSNYQVLLKGDQCLGKSSFGYVTLVYNKTKNRREAMKVINKDAVSKFFGNNLLFEKFSQKPLNHPNVIKNHDYFEDDKNLYLVMEYAEYGNMYEQLKKVIKFSEKEAFNIFIQTAFALDFQHKNKIVHGSLKPENLLIDSNRKIKLCDYGWPAISNDQMRATFFGKSDYIAPEIINYEEYSYGVDIWSLGVLLYELLHGRPPNTQNKSGPEFHKDLSLEIKDLITNLLIYDQYERVDLHFLFSHPWIKIYEKLFSLDISNIRKMGKVNSNVYLEKGIPSKGWKSSSKNKSLQISQKKSFINNTDSQSAFDYVPECSVCCKILIESESAVYYSDCVCCLCYCKTCIKSLVLSAQEQKKYPHCSMCQVKMEDWEIKEILSESEFDKFFSTLISKNGDIVTCVNEVCQNVFLFEAGRKDQGEYIIKDRDGQNLTENQMVFTANNRFKCPVCYTEQCKSCGENPFHLGFTCDNFKNQILCRYCMKEPLDFLDLKAKPLSDICLDPECFQKAENACKQIMACKHRCSGVKNHVVNDHFCTKEYCNEIAIKNVNCGFCTETLYSSPSVYSTACKHGFHYGCLKNCLQKKHHTQRITFGYMNCPDCRVEINLDNLQKTERLFFFFESGGDQLYTLLKQCKEKKNEIAKLIENNIFRDVNVEQAPLEDKNHRFYKKPVEYGQAIYSIYPCFKCKKPYIGGRVACDQEADLNLNSDFRAENYSCLECNNFMAFCAKHGGRNMIWKCRYCCNLALFFCFGTTHFCDTCHKVAGRNKTKRCPGVNKCKLMNGNHAVNGKESMLGCEMCLGI